MKKIRNIIFDFFEMIKYKLYLVSNGVALGRVRRYGVTKVKREKKIIVSLTSYSTRLNSVYKTIRTLLKQSYKPDHVIIWLSDDMREEDLPIKLLELKKYGLDIYSYKNIKSYKKLIPTLKMFPNDIIITADDDIYYPKNWIKELIDEYHRDEKCILSNKIGRFVLKDNELNYVPGDDIYRGSISCFNKLLGACGVLYPPGALNENVFEEELFTSLVPTNDDLWFWLNGLLNGYKVKFTKRGLKKFLYVEGSQDGACLWKENEKINITDGNEFYRQLKCLLDKYPQIKKLMESENV